MNKIAIKVDLVRASIGKTPILSSINLSITAGRWTAIVGPNGAGKSSLLQCLAGLWSTQPAHALEGRVLVGADDVRRMPGPLRARQIAWLGQSESSSDALRVWDVVMLGRLPHIGWLGRAGAADELACEQALRALQALDWRDRLLGELSVGQRQRVQIARALATQAPILLMDEPLAHLDAPHQADWLAQVRSLSYPLTQSTLTTGPQIGPAGPVKPVQGHASTAGGVGAVGGVGGGGHALPAGVTVVSVLHELPMALQADELVVMKAGQVVYHGAADSDAWRAVEAVFDQRFVIQPTAWGPVLSYPLQE